MSVKDVAIEMADQVMIQMLGRRCLLIFFSIMFCVFSTIKFPMYIEISTVDMCTLRGIMLIDVDEGICGLRRTAQWVVMITYLS